MYYINCGQFPYPFMAEIDRDKETPEIKITVLEGKGTPVGLFKSPNFTVREIAFPKCFKMAMFSDGILEILSNESIKNSDQYLHGLFKNADTDIDKISQQLGLENRSSFPDDLTFLMIERDIDSGENNAQ